MAEVWSLTQLQGRGGAMSSRGLLLFYSEAGDQIGGVRTVSWNIGGRGAMNMKREHEHENYMCAALINTPKTACWVPVFVKLLLDSQFFTF